MEDHTDAWSDMVPGVYRTYRSNAKKAGRVFELTQEMYDDLAQRPCMYCQRAITETNRSGIDRIDNDGGYVSGNLAPACSECNFMRGTLPVWTFLEQAARIAARAEVLEIPDMPACHSSMTRRQKKTPSV
jgi:hypothetical protein